MALSEWPRDGWTMTPSLSPRSLSLVAIFGTGDDTEEKD
jgi:hypothetical protein